MVAVRQILPLTLFCFASISLAQSPEHLSLNNISKIEAAGLTKNISQWDDAYTGKYTGNNNVSLCTISDEPVCHSLKIPDKVGEVKEIVYGKFDPRHAASWLAFTDKSISFCVSKENQLEVKCAAVGLIKYRGIEIRFDKKSTGIPSLVFSSTTADKSYIKAISEKFLQRVYAAADSLDNSAENFSRSNVLRSDQPESPQTEEPLPEEGYVVEIWAPYINYSGGGGVVLVPIFLGDPPVMTSTPPDGVAPGDILNARDPVGMASCTAAYYRVYMTMVGSCNSLRFWNQTRVCLEKSINAYWNNLETECYAKYY